MPTHIVPQNAATMLPSGTGSTDFAMGNHTHPGGSQAFPVGAVFIAVVSTNPATLLGYGTWSAFGAGRVMVGLNSGDTDFDVAEETGGAKTNTPTGTNSAPAFTGSALATHSHTAGTFSAAAQVFTGNASTAVVNHVHTLATGTTATGNFSQVIGTVDTSSGGTGATPTQTALGTLSGNPVGGAVNYTPTGTNAASAVTGTSQAITAGTPTGTVAAPTFTGAAMSIVQPYIVCYFWKRTA